MGDALGFIAGDAELDVLGIACAELPTQVARFGGRGSEGGGEAGFELGDPGGEGVAAGDGGDELALQVGDPTAAGGLGGGEARGQVVALAGERGEFVRVVGVGVVVGLAGDHDRGQFGARGAQQLLALDFTEGGGRGDDLAQGLLDPLLQIALGEGLEIAGLAGAGQFLDRGALGQRAEGAVDLGVGRGFDPGLAMDAGGARRQRTVVRRRRGLVGEVRLHRDSSRSGSLTNGTLDPADQIHVEMTFIYGGSPEDLRPSVEEKCGEEGPPIPCNPSSCAADAVVRPQKTLLPNDRVGQAPAAATFWLSARR